MDIQNNPDYIYLGNNRYISKKLYQEAIERYNKNQLKIDMGQNQSASGHPKED